mgnify:CR=1 FL=1
MTGRMTVIGFRVNIDGVMRVFHDVREVAFGMARELKRKNRHSKVEILDERYRAILSEADAGAPAP